MGHEAEHRGFEEGAAEADAGSVPESENLPAAEHRPVSELGPAAQRWADAERVPAADHTLAADRGSMSAAHCRPAVQLCVAVGCEGCEEAGRCGCSLGLAHECRTLLLSVDRLYRVRGCFGTPCCDIRCMVCRLIQTLESRLAGLQSVLSSTRQRAAAERHALETLRREHAELQVPSAWFLVHGFINVSVRNLESTTTVVKRRFFVVMHAGVPSHRGEAQPVPRHDDPEALAPSYTVQPPPWGS